MKKQKRKKQKKKIDLWRSFSNTYYLLQYTLVHILYFGFVIEPIKLAPKILTAFHWAEIATGIANFSALFVVGVQFQSVVLLLISCIPLTAILIWQAKYLIIYVFVLFQLVWFLIIKARWFFHELQIKLDNVVVVKIGAPGCGKSSSGLYEAVVMARKMWRKLRWKYYCYSHEVNKWCKEPRRYQQKLIEWFEIKFSYEYFTRIHRVVTYDMQKDEISVRFFYPVPCLLSNIPVMVDGKMTAFVGKKHLQQKMRLPAFSVLFVDEVGAILPLETSKQRMSSNRRNKNDSEEQIEAAIADKKNAVQISDFFRLCRHFGDFRIVCTEQDSENIYIDVRRVVSKNEYMISQKWVLKPYLFLAIFLPLQALCIRWERGQCVLVPPLMFLEKLIRHIGFRKYRYLTENNTERTAGMEKGKRTFYLPSMLNFFYDERTFRNFYKCKDEVCEPHIFENLVLEDTDMFRSMFLRSESSEAA